MPMLDTARSIAIGVTTTVSWPTDADFDSDVLYVKVTAGPIPEHVTANKAR